MNENTYQFKDGDIVRILPKNEQEDYNPAYVESMLKYAGGITRITAVGSRSCLIGLDEGRYYWPFKALLLVTSGTDTIVDPCNLKNGDYIKITSSLDGYIYIFKKMENNRIFKHASYTLYSKDINVDPKVYWLLNDNPKITYATEEEKKLLDNALLQEGYKWNDLTKQLDSIGLIDIRTNNLPNKYDMYIDTLDCTKEKPQTETELNLFPTKKHYQLNFNY